MLTKPQETIVKEFSFKDDLFEYQEEDAQEIAASNRNYMILSEMGTGKTPTVQRIVDLKGFESVLVLCPKNLRLEWDRQIRQWSGKKPVVCHKGTRRRLEPLFNSMTDKVDYAPYFILNYDSFRSKPVMEVMELMKFDCIVLDEVHMMRNAESKTTEGLIKFLEGQSQAKIYTLTGSPIVNNMLDMHTILSIVRPEAHSLKNRWEFLNEYAYWSPGRGKPKVFGTKNTDAFHNYIEKFSIRRLKKDCLKWLPEKVKHPVLLEMEDDQQEAYDTMAQELFVMLDDGEEYYAPGVLAQLTRLRQINLDPRLLGLKLSSSKTEYLLDMVESIDAPVVIASTFESYCSMLGKDLEKRGISQVQLTGKVSAEKFAQNVKDFQDGKVKVALLTTKMGQGITLTASSVIALADRWWTPTANNQVIDRLHRPGQENSVEIVLPSNQGSIDQAMDRILASKQEVADSMLNESSTISEVVDDMRRYLRY